MEKKHEGEEKKDVKEIYALLEKQHKLPTFDVLTANFDIDVIDPECKHLLKEITKKIFERIETIKKILETILQPDVSILSMQESEFLTDADHDMITDITRRLMLLDRTLLIAEIENSEELYVAFINEATKEWQNVKKDVTPIVTRMQLGWSKKEQMKPSQHYLG